MVESTVDVDEYFPSLELACGCLQEGNFRDVEDWLPPLDGEEPEELKDEEEEASGESGDEEEEAEADAPPAPVARKTRQQTLKEMAKMRKPASPSASQEVDSKAGSSSSGVRALDQTPPHLKKQEGSSPAAVAGREEHRAQGVLVKRAAGRIQRTLVPVVRSHVPVGSRVTPPLPVAK